MDLSSIQIEYRHCISQGDTERFESIVLSTPSEHGRIVSGNIREIDYLLYYSIGHNRNDEASLRLCTILFSLGANPNASFYTQTKVGFCRMPPNVVLH